MNGATPVASLPMYDWPEVRWATDALWSAIRDRLRSAGIEAPEALNRSRPSDDVWLDPGLVLSQTCGWPYITRLTSKVRLASTPAYRADGCVRGLYSSIVVAQAGGRQRSLADFRGSRVAVNSFDSLSGFIVLRREMRAAGLDIGDVEWIETGDHRSSVRAVVSGEADLAAIDAVCWALAGRHDADAVARLRIVARTSLRPGLPFITASAAPPETLQIVRHALAAAIGDDLAADARNALFLAGVEQIDEREYADLATLADPPKARPAP